MSSTLNFTSSLPLVAANAVIELSRFCRFVPHEDYKVIVRPYESFLRRSPTGFPADHKQALKDAVMKNCLDLEGETLGPLVLVGFIGATTSWWVVAHLDFETVVYMTPTGITIIPTPQTQ